MKKILVVIALLFAFTKIVNAETFYATEDVKEVPIYLDKISKQNYRYFKTAYRRSDNVLVYCVEPAKLLSVVDNYSFISYNQNKYLNISEEQWRRIELLSYFGYGYENHLTNKWAAITQYMIWQTVLPEGWFLTFTDGYGGEFKNIHQVETNEIESLIKNFETLPSFSNESYKITKNNKLILVDNNNILNQYKLTTSSEISVKIDNNTLEIEATKNGEYVLEFVRGEYQPTKLYISENNQSVVSTDGSPENKFYINVTVQSGDITIKRAHNDYLDNDATNINATYEIIDSENNKKILNTDKFGQILIKDLPLGEVIIKEIKPSEGYEIDNNEYRIEIQDNETAFLEIKPQLIIKKINVTKKYLNEKDNVLPNEINSVFSVLKDNDIKLTNKTDHNGLVSFDIPYGKYMLVQNSTIIGYELMKDYDIFVEDSEELNLTFINYKIENKNPIEPEIKEEKEEINEPIKEIEDNKEEENFINIENPKTGDNISFWIIISLLIGSILCFKLRKMQ